MMRILSFLLLFIPVFVHANDNCEIIQKPFVHQPSKQVRLVVDPRQEVIFDGVDKTPRILMIDSVGTKDRPRLKVMTGLQVLENGSMKSYPNRVSIRLPTEEQGMTPRVIQVVFGPTSEKTKAATLIQIEYKKVTGKDCLKPEIKKFQL